MHTRMTMRIYNRETGADRYDEINIDGDHTSVVKAAIALVKANPRRVVLAHIEGTRYVSRWTAVRVGSCAIVALKHRGLATRVAA